jgi:hypothetical protein
LAVVDPSGRVNSIPPKVVFTVTKGLNDEDGVNEGKEKDIQLAKTSVDEAESVGLTEKSLKLIALGIKRFIVNSWPEVVGAGRHH